MKILVTGGAGFIGSHTCEALLARGDHVICIDNFNDYYDPKIKEKNILGFANHPNIRIYRADIGDLSILRTIFTHEQPEKVIHLAASAGVQSSMQNPFIYAHNNITGLLHMLELSRQFNIKNFVFGSSSSVYGNRDSVPFREDDSAERPISPYASTKRSGELLCYTYSHVHHLPVTCLRFFTVYGPRGRPDMAPYKFIRSIMQQTPITMYGDGTTMRDYTYVSDIVAGILATLDKNFSYEIINLGNSNPVSLHEFITTIETTVGKKAQLNQEAMKPGDVQRTYADISKAQTLLGWTPKISLREGIQKTYEYLQTN